MSSMNNIERRGVRIIVTTPTRGCSFKAAITLAAMVGFCFGLMAGFALAATYIVG